MENVPAKRKTLGEATVDLELILRKADEKDGDLTWDEIHALDLAKGTHAARVDGWGDYLASAKALVAHFEEKKANISRALKMAENLQDNIKTYLRHILTEYPTLPWRGEDVALYLHKNPKRLWLMYGGGEEQSIYGGPLKIGSVSVPNVVSEELLATEPGLRKYVREVKVWQLDKDEVKADLEAGMQLKWARFEQGHHVRTKQV